jgi:hypothetical protein
MFKHGYFKKNVRSIWSFVRTSIAILIKTKSFRKVIISSFPMKIWLSLG